MLLSSQPVVGGRHTNNTAEIQVNKLNYIRSVRTSFHLITFMRLNIIQSPCGAFLLHASSLNLICWSVCLRFVTLAVFRICSFFIPFIPSPQFYGSRIRIFLFQKGASLEPTFSLIFSVTSHPRSFSPSLSNIHCSSALPCPQLATNQFCYCIFFNTCL